MKSLKIINCILCLFIAVNATAQNRVGIGTTTPDASAILDVQSTTQGILIPRVSESQRTGIASPSLGLLVYQTNNTSGFYYFKGGDWRLISSEENFPTVIGDTDFDTGIDLEENTDDDMIRFYESGIEYFRMDDGRLEVLNSGNSIFLGNDAGINDDNSNNRNVSIGTNTLKANISGDLNTAIGYNAFDDNTTGFYNNAHGNNALGKNTTGAGNVGIGYLANFNNIDGTYNTAAGPYAGVLFSLITLTNATAIGANAKVNQDNSLVLGNNADVGIGTSQPDDKLHVLGSIKINDGTQAAGNVLVSDENGLADWDNKLTFLSDADGDTKVRVEDTPDEDIIHFDIGGTEYFNMNNGRLEVLNTNQSVYIGEAAGANYLNTSSNNVGIGYSALYATTSGQSNIAIGRQALVNNTTGSGNGALGMNALDDNSTGSYNVGVGLRGLEFNVDGTFNSAIGYKSGVQTNYPDLINTTAIGNAAGIVQDSSIVLGNNADVGIGTSQPGAKLHVVGKLRYRDGTEAKDNVLISDGDGLASWLDLSSNTMYDFDENTILHPAGEAMPEDVSDTLVFDNRLGDLYKFQANLRLRLFSGSGVDPFIIRVISRCNGNTSLANSITYTPPESSNDHDNFLIIPYLHVFKSNCTANTIEFILQVRNSGDDDWEISDVMFMVTKY